MSGSPSKGQQQEVMYMRLSSMASLAWRCLLFVVLLASVSFAQALKEVAKFDLPGPGGKRFDYLTIDPTTNTSSRPTLELTRPTSSISVRTRSWQL